MPKETKTLNNMTKHLTNAEIEARAAVEEQILPARAIVRAPKSLRTDKAAKRYWKDTLERMDGLQILDVLDTDMLAVYCRMMSRHDDLLEEYGSIRARLEDEGLPSELRAGFDKALTAVCKQLKETENTILSYATKLGLTPDGRARLARRAAAETEEEEDSDLFAK